jgi:hypothetical protein
VPAGRILSLLASWNGIADAGDDAEAADLIGKFDVNRIPRTPIVFDPAAARLESAPR